MDPFNFPPIATLLNAAYTAVVGLVSLLDPIAGTASAALAIVALTVVVRALLIPVGVSQVKAEWTRRRLAPKLQALQKRYKKNPQLLQEKTMALYREEKASPFAGILSALAQLPPLHTCPGDPDPVEGVHVRRWQIGSAAACSLRIAADRCGWATGCSRCCRQGRSRPCNALQGPARPRKAL